MAKIDYEKIRKSPNRYKKAFRELRNRVLEMRIVGDSSMQDMDEIIFLINHYSRKTANHVMGWIWLEIDIRSLKQKAEKGYPYNRVLDDIMDITIKYLGDDMGKLIDSGFGLWEFRFDKLFWGILWGDYVEMNESSLAIEDSPHNWYGDYNGVVKDMRSEMDCLGEAMNEIEKVQEAKRESESEWNRLKEKYSKDINYSKVVKRMEKIEGKGNTDDY